MCNEIEKIKDNENTEEVSPRVIEQLESEEEYNEIDPIKNLDSSTNFIHSSNNVFNKLNTINYDLSIKMLRDIFNKNKYVHSLDFEETINNISKEEFYKYINKFGNIILIEEDDINKNYMNYVFIEDFNKEYFLLLSYQNDTYCKYLKFYLYIKDNNKIVKSKEKLLNIIKDIKYVTLEQIINLKYYFTFKNGTPEFCIKNEKVEKYVNNENYPFINDCVNYVEEYIKSDSTLLFLIGSPGTGKTRFIRYLLSQLNKAYKNNSFYFTSDSHVIEHGKIFTDFFINDGKIMILEDFDFHLDSRKNGNMIMYHLLGVSDGLVQCNDRKIIISSNLNNLANVDEALLRHGRCFDVINFRKLTYEESCHFMEKNNKKDLIHLLENKDHSLADLYYLLNNQEKREIEMINKIKVGF